jgi:hypothetical protein
MSTKSMSTKSMSKGRLQSKSPFTAPRLPERAGRRRRDAAEHLVHITLDERAIRDFASSAAARHGGAVH